MTPALVVAHSTVATPNMAQAVSSRIPAFAAGGTAGLMGMMSSGSMAPLAGGVASGMAGGSGAFPGTEIEASGPSAFSFTPGSYRFVDGSGFLGRVGEYDTLQQSVGADFSGTYVSTQNHITLASRANVLTGDDYAIASQLTAGERLQVGLFVRSFMQQQDHYNFYAFPVLDIPPGDTVAPDTTTDLIPRQAVFGVKRRLGNAYARGKVPRLPVHWFIITYTRLHDTYTHYPQNSFGSDETLTWRPIDRFRLIADYHQQNVLNDFTPYLHGLRKRVLPPSRCRIALGL
jgi:hypothetical protein